MNSRSRSRSIVVVGALLLTIQGSDLTARAETEDFRVQVGAVHPTNASAPYEYTRFYPSTLKVHSGQTVRWDIVGSPETFTGFHTVTFSKAGRPAFLRADEAPGSYATPEAWALGSACGRGTAPACVLTDTTEFLSSGIPPFGNSPFRVKFDVPAGGYEFFCTVHPAMSGTVQVVPEDNPLPTREQIQQDVTADIAADSDDADAVNTAGQTPVSTIENGQRVWSVRLGDSTQNNNVSILAYLPSNLQIDAGDKVRYVSRSGVVNEIHTVTFPSAAVGSFSPGPHGLGGLAFYPSCDLDDPAGGAPGIPGAWGVFGPECPGSPELLVSPWLASPHPAPGNMVTSPAAYHDSGMLIPEAAPANFRTFPDTGALVPSSFEAEFPFPGRFTYECSVHVDPMTGGVEVS